MQAGLSEADMNLYQVKLISAIIDYIHQGGLNALNKSQKEKLFGFTARQCCLLTAVRCITDKLGKGVTLSHLARDLHMSISAASHLVDTLVENNMLERKAHAGDRRSVVISLSENGRQYAEASRSGMLQAILELTSELTPEENAVRLRIIERLYRKIHPTAAEAAPSAQGAAGL